MPQLSWNEVRNRAIRFAREWRDAAAERSDKQTFWNEFFDCFGVPRKSVAVFEHAVANARGHYGSLDLFWPGVLLVEHKSRGASLLKAESQAFAYLADLAREDRHDELPRYVILCDFQRFALYDLEPEDQRELPLFDTGQRFRYLEFPLPELHYHVREFAFIKGEKPVRLDPENPANLKATALLADLHDTLEQSGFTGHALERTLVRLLFCLFAEDTGIFEPMSFTMLIENSREDGADLGQRLAQLFQVLNTAPEQRQRTLDEDFVTFPYVNGGLFEEALPIASFTRDHRDALLRCCHFHWAKISPAVFGSLFQGVMDARERRQIGGHYTSERDIMKLLRSLFLDDLRAELDAALADRSTRRDQRLRDYQKKLRRLRLFDPACGCGNFLILAYREMRRLEKEALVALHDEGQLHTDVRDLAQVDVDQFHGIEINEWPVRIAEVGLWLTDHQCNMELAEALGESFSRLPLKAAPTLRVANALRTDWRELLPPMDNVLVLGNPPFVGKHLMNTSQEEDMELVWGGTDGAGVLDYVTAWYMKAAQYIRGTRIRCAFVSTNSITQGEQAGALWNQLFQRHGIKIHFAHRTFSWESEARGKAHVHVVIIGFGVFDTISKRLYDYEAGADQPTVTEVRNISPYLIEGPNTAVTSRGKPLCEVPECIYGNKPTDGGHLIVEEDDRIVFLANNPLAQKYLRPLLCAEEYLNNIPRWCLWLVDAAPADIAHIDGIRERVQAVRDFRLASKKAPTRQKADQPALFAEIRQPKNRYIIIPRHSSEARRYVPFGYFPPEVIVHDSCTALPDATLYHFGVLSSAMHMAWVRVVCGRLKSDYRYSNKLVYNNFPWPDIAARGEVSNHEPAPVHPSTGSGRTDALKQAVEAAAQAVLDARAQYPDSTLADLYDPLTMPAPLAKAHAELDRAVDRCYRREPFESDRARVEHLFTLYNQLTAPLLPAAPKRPRKPRHANELFN